MDEKIKSENDIPVPKPKRVERDKIKGLHTYESDMARAIRDNNGSLVKISLAEQKRKENEVKRGVISKEKSNNFKYVILGIVLIAVVFFGASFVNKLIKDRSVNQSVVEKRETFFATEEQVFLPANLLVGKESSAQAILATIKAKSVSVQMNSIFFKKETEVEGKSLFLGTQEIIARLGLSAPGPLVRSLDNNMILGSFTPAGSEPKLYIVFRTNSYDQAFAGMLSWEENLFGDLFTIFGFELNSSNSYLLNKKWEDLLIDNNDARVLKTTDGDSVLYYMFLDRNILIITDSLPTIRESIKRLRIEKSKI